MSRQTLSHRLFSLERELLRCLCSGTHSELSPKQISQELGRYTWKDSDHQVIFQALVRISARAGGSISREQLAAETTRMGFPDIDLAEYFLSPPSEQTPMGKNESAGSVTALIQQLNSAQLE